MRTIAIATLPAALAATGAAADPGHLAELAGHNHWVAGAAIGAAIALGAWAALKGRRGADPAPAPSGDDTCPAETET